MDTNIQTTETLINTAETLLSLFERIVEPSAADSDVLEAATTIRTHLNGLPEGERPSIILKWIVLNGTDIGQRLEALEKEKETLTAQLASQNTFCLDSGCVLHESVAPQAENGHYKLESFMAALQRKMGRTYGWRVDYIVATQTTPDAKLVRNEDIQKWQKNEKVPDWAYEQIPILVFPKRNGKKHGSAWTDENYDYLGELHLADPVKPNSKLAEECSVHFGRDITENAIKGALDRLRKKKKVPKKRSSKT